MKDGVAQVEFIQPAAVEGLAFFLDRWALEDFCVSAMNA